MSKDANFFNGGGGLHQYGPERFGRLKFATIRKMWEWKRYISGTENGRMADILGFRYNILHITRFHRRSLGGAVVTGFGGGMRSTECALLG